MAGVWNDVSCEEANGVICQRKVDFPSKDMKRDSGFKQAGVNNTKFDMNITLITYITLVILLLILICLYGFIPFFSERQESDRAILIQNHYI